MQYIVMEIQVNGSGTIGTLVTSFAERNLAEQQYHTVLAAAAVSALPVHAAVLLTEDGRTVERGCYRHESEAEAEEE